MLITQHERLLRRLVRQVLRQEKREDKHAAYRKNGLNGPRAMARRARQQARIEARK